MSIEKELARFDHDVVSLEGALETAIKLAQRALDALRNEEALAVSKDGITRRVVDSDFTRRIKDAVHALEGAARAQIALDKTAALRAKQMTQEERLVAFETAVSSMPYPTRRKLVLAIIKAHNDRAAEAIAYGLQDEPKERTFVDVA